MMSEDEGQGSSRGRTFATVATIIVAALGLLSSTVWGPPICRALGVCQEAASSTGPEITSSPSGPSTSPTFEKTTSPTPRETGTGYPASAGDYCAEFVRAWQDQYQNRAADLSTAQIAATVFKITPPVHFRNDWGPTGNGAVCTIVDTDRGNAQVIKVYITKTMGQPGAITSVVV
jgi:hypothetical protein